MKEPNNNKEDVRSKNSEAKKSAIAEKEEKILAFWNERGIFEKSLKQTEGGKEYVFYDGPPFATGTPHYGHILAGTIKDVIPRFETMRGRHVPRRWGWDCHGLPVENLIEKQLGLKTKKEIEEYGIERFNEEARKSVMKYDKEWKEIVPRLGRWVDMEHAYKTMDSWYTESVMWSFRELWKKKLVYQGFKSMHVCPRCETTLSNFEVNQGYKDVTDISVTVKFELADEPGTYLLAWTTTPWTLPGNVAAAVNPKVDYIKAKKDDFIYIVAEPLANKILKENFEIIETFKGKKLIGKSYKPVFDYYANDPKLKNRENGWKVYGADFVTTEDGTGIVHIAPAFGEDDMRLGQEKNLPFVQHVFMNGAFKAEVMDFAGQQVKPKGEPQKADVEIIKNLAGRGLLFAKEKITHSYPHCWRCDTPLLNYAAASWFVRVTEIKDKLAKENKKVEWVPADIKEGRFGKWLEGARDWAISRSRYWGAPLPVWKCEKCEKADVIGGLEDIRERTKSSNAYILMRHGEGEHNVRKVLSSSVSNDHRLTDRGRGEAKASGRELKARKIDLIIASPLVRARETAELVAKELGLESDSVIFDDRLREVGYGDWDNLEDRLYSDPAYYPSLKSKFEKAPPGGEDLNDVKRRVGRFIYETDAKYSGRNILIISHESPLWLMAAVAKGADAEGAVKLWGDLGKGYLDTGRFRDLDFSPIPHDGNFVLDYHRPYIDSVAFPCDECGSDMKRVPEVFDCWYESGSMPYAQFHYPFHDGKIFDPKKQKRFPADFIAEGLDQTRGWFYSLLVLSTGLFDSTPYKNVIVNGIVLAEDGQKMSKSLKNYPDPMEVVNKYGADALRLYMLTSPVIRAEDLAFSEKGLDETMKKFIMRLGNVVSFYDMYSSESKGLVERPDSGNILDQWIVACLDYLNYEMVAGFEKYELDRATRPLLGFVDDLSTWYLRRSRDRFKSEDEKDKKAAMETLRYVLIEFAKHIAPVAPFISEDIYQRLAGEGRKESVHLECWPTPKKPSAKEKKIIEEMAETRRIVSLGLEARFKAGIKVRQPLQSISVHAKLAKEYVALVEDELNVKEVKYDAKAKKGEVALDTNITAELKEEGQLREIVRFVQDLRKKAGLNPGELVTLGVSANDSAKKLIEKFRDELTKSASLKDIIFTAEVAGDELAIEEIKLKAKLEK